MVCPSHICSIVFTIPSGLQLQDIGVSAEEGRMATVPFTAPSSEWIVVRYCTVV